MDFLLRVTLSPEHGLSGLGVIPIMVGPLNALVAALPAIMLALFALIVTLFKPSTMKRLSLLVWSQKAAVCTIAIVIVGLVYGYSILFADKTDKGAVGVGNGQWPLFRGGSDRRAFIAQDPAKGKAGEDPAHGQINWSYADGKINTFYSSPAVVRNRVYITGSSYGYFSDKGAIFSLNAETGKLVWKFIGDGYRSAVSSPAISGKYLVVGEGLHMVKDSRIFCLDIEASEKANQGKKLWDYRTTSHMESSPCIDNDRVFVGAGDDGVLCLQLEPENGKAKLLWQLPGKEYPDCESAPMVYDGKLYFGLGRKIHAMICADPKTGAEIWRVATPYTTAPPAISKGKLYFGMGVGDFINDAEALRGIKQKEMEAQKKGKAEIAAALEQIKDAGEVWCLDLATHEKKWSFDVGQTILGTPAVDEDRIYFGARDGYLYCLSTAGQLIRKFNAHSPIVSCPSVGDKYVYVVTTAGILYGLDKKTMAMVWSIGLNNSSFSSPTVAHGQVYVGTNGGGLVSVGLPGRQKDPPVWPGELGGAGRSGTVDGSRIAGAGGTYSWSYMEGEAGNGGAPAYAVSSPAAIINTTFYVGLSEKGVFGVAALACGEEAKTVVGVDDSDEALRLSRALANKPIRVWMSPAKYAVTLSPAATEDYVFFVEGRAGDKDRMLRCIDRRSGRELWSHPIGDDGSGEFSVSRDKLFIADSGRGVTCLAVTGSKQELWTADVGGCIGMPGAAGDFVALAARNPAKLMVLDGGTGQALWHEDLAEPSGCGAVIFRDRIWAASSAGVSAFNLVPGQEQLPPIECGPIKGRILCDIDHLAFTTAAGELIVADAEPQTVASPKKAASGSGPAGGIVAAAIAPASQSAGAAKVRAISRIPGVSAGIGPILVDDGMLYYTKDSIQRYDLRTKKSSLWARVTADFPGAITTPMVMMNSHVFFGTEIEGFVCFKPKKDLP